MVDVYPFRGLRYQVPNLSQVTAPPYDVITDADQDRLYARDPRNVVRLILNRKEALDNDAVNMYSRAQGFFTQWQEEGTLVPEPQPAFYVYTQTFKDPADPSGPAVTRKGILALIRLAGFDEGIVYPHEHTLKGPIQDRFRLMGATLANLSPIFMLYDDPKRTLESSELYGNQHPWQAAEIQEEPGVTHAFYPVTDPEQLAHIQGVFCNQYLIIADGHHRYETELAFQAEVRRRYKEAYGHEAPAGSLPSDYGMVFLANMADGGLRVYPTHRLLKHWPSGWDRSKFEAVFAEVFESCAPDESVFAYGFPGDKAPRPVKLKNKAHAMAGTPELFWDLDVAVLDQVVVQSMFGTTANQLKDEKVLWYERDAQVVADWMAGHHMEVVFYMGTPSMPQMRDIIRAGYRMPQKSTFFAPKLLSGLVFYYQGMFADGSGHGWNGVDAPATIAPLDGRQLFPQPVAGGA